MTLLVIPYPLIGVKVKQNFNLTLGVVTTDEIACTGNAGAPGLLSRRFKYQRRPVQRTALGRQSLQTQYQGFSPVTYAIIASNRIYVIDFCRNKCTLITSDTIYSG